MEIEKKRKRGGEEKKKERDDKVTVPAPTDNEVEEFFAILQRMHVAVKYLEKSNVGLDGRKLTEKIETEFLELVDVDHIHDNNNNNNVVKKQTHHGGLDLNRIPEEESSS